MVEKVTDFEIPSPICQPILSPTSPEILLKTVDLSRPMVHFDLQILARKAISCFRFQKISIFSTFYKVLWHHRDSLRPLEIILDLYYYDFTTEKNLKCLPESLHHTKVDKNCQKCIFGDHYQIISLGLWCHQPKLS